jgi:hypothetical protein
MDGPRKRLFLYYVEMLRQCFAMKMTFKRRIWDKKCFFVNILQALEAFEEVLEEIMG